eukprot:COSAG02_NODE_186_length_30414_cov_24.815372_7_plen_78_part_00
MDAIVESRSILISTKSTSGRILRAESNNVMKLKIQRNSEKISIFALENRTISVYLAESHRLSASPYYLVQLSSAVGS